MEFQYLVFVVYVCCPPSSVDAEKTSIVIAQSFAGLGLFDLTLQKPVIAECLREPVHKTLPVLEPQSAASLY